MADNAPTGASTDPWAGFAAFLQQFGALPVPTADQLATLTSYAPILGLYQQLNQGDLQSKYYETELQKMANDYNLSKEQLAQAKIQTEFQQGPYFDYLKLKTANDMQMSNNEVLNSKNQLGISGNQLAMSGEYVKQSKNQALASAYQAQQAGDYAKAAHYDYLVKTGLTNSPTVGHSAFDPASLGY